MRTAGKVPLLLCITFIIGLSLGVVLRPRLVGQGDASEATPFLLEGVPDVRQSTTYSCGAAALQALLSYWGIDTREQDLMQKLGTTPEEGTSPQAIVRVAGELGCEASLKENLGFEEIDESLRRRVPVICAIQAWTDSRTAQFSWDKAWEDGHYVIVLGLDSRSVYVEDPSLLGTRGVIPRAEFAARWHDYRGEPPYDPSDRAYIRLGVFIVGKKIDAKPAYTPVE